MNKVATLRGSGYDDIVRWAVICYIDLPPCPGRILLELSFFANNRGEMVPGPTLDTLQQFTGYSRPTLLKAIDDLQEWGYLRKEVVRASHTWRTNYYLAGASVGWKSTTLCLGKKPPTVRDKYRQALATKRRGS